MWAYSSNLVGHLDVTKIPTDVLYDRRGAEGMEFPSCLYVSC